MKAITERLRILVDSEVLAVPNAPVDSDSAEAYVERLIALTRLLLDQRFTLVRSDEAWEVLELQNACPPWEGSPLDHIVADSDLLSLFLGVIQRCATISSEAGVTDVLFTGEQVRPPDHLEGRSDIFCDDYFRVLVSWWIPNGDERPRGCAPMLTVGLADPVKVDITAEIHEVEPDVLGGLGLPCVIDGATKHLSSLGKLASTIDPVSLLQNRLIELAFRAEVAQRTGDTSTWLDHDLPYSVHADFLPSAKRLGFLDNEGQTARLLRASVDILMDQRLDQTHWIRTGPGGADPQLVRGRDGAGAWRKDIDHEFHLHYWKRANHVEFALVAKHRSTYIPE